MITTALARSDRIVSSSEADVSADLREQAARRLYDAEVALHAARQSRVEAWITCG